MKKTLRFISAVLCVVVIASLFASVSAFADEGKPGPDDLKDAGKYVSAPKSDESWLDEYKTAYIYAPGFCQAAYTFCASKGDGRLRSVAQGTEVTVLAEENSRCLVKTEEGKAFWVYDECLADHKVAIGRLLSDNPEADANGPCLDDIKGINKEMDRPTPKEWLDEAVECYVYAPRYHLGAEKLYYNDTPTSPEAIAKNYDSRRDMGSVKQGTAITLLAHHGNRYLVKTEDGELFWMFDWCTSETLVPYGEAK